MMQGIFALLALVALATGNPVFDHCDYHMENIPETYDVQQVMGVWYYIRKGPINEEVLEHGSFDCLNEAIWQEYKGDANKFSYLHHVRKDEKMHIAKSTTFELTPATGDHMYNNDLKISKNIELPHGGEAHVDIQKKLVETDGGKTWSIWAACVTKGDNSTLLWSIKSRWPTVDAKIEQMLVEKVEKYGGVGPSQLRGIGQTHCHK